MKINEIFKTALTALNANKLRSFLTMLGVIIGVFAVVVLIAIGKGLENYITDTFNELGSNLLFISPGNISFGGSKDPASAMSRNRLEEKHVKLIETYAGDFISDVSPTMTVAETVTYKTKGYLANVTGLNYEGFDLFNYEIEYGRTFTKSEERSNAKVVVLGPLTVEELFPNRNPVGERVEVGGDSYTVIGTFKKRGQSYDDGVIAPYTSVKKTFDLDNLAAIAMTVREGVDVDRAAKRVESALFRDLKEDDFTVMSQEEILTSISDILGILTAGLGAIAGISLVVGGIGIMNIMFVSVTERTREIGLRKALGATPSNIASQFLLESVILSTSGGTIGLILGWLGSTLGGKVINIRTEVPWWAILLSFGFAAAVGILFGTYPAISAAKKDPIEALRYE